MKIFLLVLSIQVFSVCCQDVENTGSFRSYDILESIKQTAEVISTAENLKSITEEDKIFLNTLQDALPNSIKPMLLDVMTSESLSNKCNQDLQYFFESVMTFSKWALKMADSYGKPESGILLGSFRWLGEYDECLKVYAPPKGNTGVGDFHGKYCTLQIPLKLGNMSIQLSNAICLPDSCNPNGTVGGILDLIREQYPIINAFNQIGSTFQNATITCKSTSKKLTAGAIFVICLLSIVAILALVGSSITVLEHYMKQSSEGAGYKLSFRGEAEMVSGDNSNPPVSNSGFELPGWLKSCKPFFNCFCIFTNGEKVLNTDGAEGHLPCLHGLRFLSMAWVIVCHCYMAGFTFIRNPLEATDHVDNWTFEIIMNGFFSVDSFYVLSGFLVAYVYFQQAPKTDGKIPWLYFYIHRYIRLTPVYMIVLAFFTTIGPHLGSGPLWPEYTTVPECKEGWWMNLLYIQNFKNQAEECMPWAWYLANDMQFYIISPLFLITLWRWPKIGYSVLGLFFSITIIANFALTYEYNLLTGIGNLLEHTTNLEAFLPKLMDFYNIIYIKPYTRLGAYLVGLVLAYYLHKRKQSESLQINTIALWTGWIVASGITLLCLFGLHHQNLSLVAASFYNGFSRIGFSLGIAWVIFVCVIGQGDVVNSILSWKVWIPLSRLTYCAFLVHPVVQSTYLPNIRKFIEFNHVNVVMLYLGTLFVSYLAALLTSLLFESPVIRLERLLRNKFANK